MTNLSKKQHIVKTLATAPNKSKKRKNLFLFLDLLGAVAKVKYARQALSGRKQSETLKLCNAS
jgi:hypothetical protein